MYAARRTGLKKELFGYVPGGYARVLERFADRLTSEHVRIELRQAATKVESTADGVAIEFAGGTRRTFDQVVVTLAAPLAARLCPGLSSDEHARLQGIQYQGVVCASFLLKRPLADFYVTNITDRWAPFTAVIEMSALVDRAHFGGRALVYLPKYLKPDDPAFSLSDREVQDMFMDGLARMYPHFRPADVECFRVSRVKYVLAISTLGYSDRLPPMTTSVPSLHIVNSAHIVNGTLNVNETIQLAEKAAARLLSQPGRVASAPVDDDQLVAAPDGART
jgi:protoporphyrinogen oxidase